MSRTVSTLKMLLFYSGAYSACLLVAGMISYTCGWSVSVGDIIAWCFYVIFVYSRS